MGAGAVFAGLGLLGGGIALALSGGNKSSSGTFPGGGTPGAPPGYDPTTGKLLLPDPPGMDSITCLAAYDALPPELRPTVMTAAALPLEDAKTAPALVALADVLDKARAIAPDKQQLSLAKSSQCLRALAAASAAKVKANTGTAPTDPSTGKPIETVPLPAPGIGPKPITDEAGVPASWDGGPPKKGFASNPAMQWLYVVQNGDSAVGIASKFFGTGTSLANTKFVELIQTNKNEHSSGRYLGSKGDPGNPWTTAFNWQNAIVTGDRLLVPKTWNAWVDQEGWRRGQVDPWPKPAGV